MIFSPPGCSKLNPLPMQSGLAQTGTGESIARGEEIEKRRKRKKFCSAHP
jgi:hypothetical protein